LIKKSKYQEIKIKSLSQIQLQKVYNLFMRPARRHNPSKSPIGAIFFLILLVLVATLGIRGFFLYKDSRWGKFDRFNVVIISKPVTFLSVNKSSQTAVVVTFPDDLYVSDLAYGYGAYRMGTVYSVGQLDRRGGETVAATVSDYLGVPVDGYIYSPKPTPADIKNFFVSPTNLLENHSNLNLLDRLQLAWAIFRLRFDKIKKKDLGSFTEPLVLSDGSTALTLEREAVDSHLQDDFVENRIRDEAFRLEILNSTAVLGLGNRAGRVLSNIGSNVVNVGTLDGALTNCQIKTTAKAKNSLTVRRVAAFYSCQISLMSEEGRAEIEVILGQDYAQKLGK